jgi:hypothetical protein
MSEKPPESPVRAVFPLNDTTLVVLLNDSFDRAKQGKLKLTSSAGLRIHSTDIDNNEVPRLLLNTSSMQTYGVVTDSITIEGLTLAGSKKAISTSTPTFVHGIKDPTELKVSHVEHAFPYSSRLIGAHVSVSCCTGCNGGIHDRNLVVLNHHFGGPWTGIWVETGKTIDTPYPRWQKVLCAGGVIAEKNGSTTVVDKGWMEIHKKFEEPHHAPPPLPIECAQLPNSKCKAIFQKGLDASWVQFDDIHVEHSEIISPSDSKTKVLRLTRNQIVFTDKSGAKSTAYLYQPSGLKVQVGQRIKQLRGFVHAEAPGQYVLLSDKEQDLFQ